MADPISGEGMVFVLFGKCFTRREKRNDFL
jgi:hypothetical protein